MHLMILQCGDIIESVAVIAGWSQDRIDAVTGAIYGRSAQRDIVVLTWKVLIRSHAHVWRLISKLGKLKGDGYID